MSGVSPSEAALAQGTRPGPAHLDVSAIDRSVAWYQDAAGLRVRSRSADGTTATLGTAVDDLLVLREKPGARRPGRHRRCKDANLFRRHGTRP